MKLIITIDTEEDNWARYSTTDNPVENIDRIIPLQMLFDEFGVKPTYLISYPVATNPGSVAILKGIVDAGNCEIGMHCHPWNTPPFNENEDICERNTMICNLPEELQYSKLASLYEVISNNFYIKPVSFRAGRWGFGSGTARALRRVGISIDTSVSPYVNWNDFQGPDFSSFGPEPFRFNPDCISSEDKRGTMLQVPATVGFLQSNYWLCQSLMEIAKNKYAKKLRLIGLMDRLRLLNKVWLSPEASDADSMILLAKRMQKNNYTCLNMSFHSNSLLKGMSPFVRTGEDEQKFLQKIRDFLVYARDAGWESQTLSQFEESFRQI